MKMIALAGEGKTSTFLGIIISAKIQQRGNTL